MSLYAVLVALTVLARQSVSSQLCLHGFLGSDLSPNLLPTVLSLLISGLKSLLTSESEGWAAGRQAPIGHVAPDKAMEALLELQVFLQPPLGSN